MFYNSEKGVSLIITFFIMIIVLAVVLAISVILYSEIRIIKDIGNSVISFYAADTGIEQTLYLDRKGEEDGGAIAGSAERGLCNICNIISGCLAEDIELNGCNPETCDNCKILFSVVFGTNNARRYEISANLTTDTSDVPSLLIDSVGSYKDVRRAIELEVGEGGGSPGTPEGPVIVSASAVPNSVPEGFQIEISTEITSEKNLASIVANIKQTPEQDPPFDTINLSYFSGITYTGTATGLPIGMYYVSIHVCDVEGHCVDSGNIY